MLTWKEYNDSMNKETLFEIAVYDGQSIDGRVIEDIIINEIIPVIDTFQDEIYMYGDDLYKNYILDINGESYACYEVMNLEEKYFPLQSLEKVKPQIISKRVWLYMDGEEI